MSQVRDAEAKGATLCTGPFKREGNLIWPVVVDNVTPDMRLAWEEVRTKGLEDVRSSEYRLACGG